jgi:hypothetical protein
MSFDSGRNSPHFFAKLPLWSAWNHCRNSHYWGREIAKLGTPRS